MLDALIEVTQGTSVWEAAAAIGTVGAAVVTLLAVLVAIFGREWWEQRHRPILRISYEPFEPYCRDTLMPIGLEGSSFVKSRWIRVKVKNEGRSTANRCKGKLMAVFQEDGNPRRDRDPLQLRWAGVPSSQNLEPLDLAREESQFLGIVYVSEISPFVQIASHDEPVGFSKTLEPARVHRLRLTVYADNAEPASDEFIVRYDGNVDNLKMERVRIPDAHHENALAAIAGS